MDELELLKKDWKKQEPSFPRVAYAEIYTMILQKSSTTIKWIFRISVLEFIFWVGIDVVLRYNGTYEAIQDDGIDQYSIVTTAISYTILIYFIIAFYRNYKKIQTTDSASILMENILKTRKTVKQYVYINLVFLTLLLVFTFGYMVWYSTAFLNITISRSTLSIILCLIIVVVVGACGLLYYVLYGLLTKKLKQNYSILQELED